MLDVVLPRRQELPVRAAEVRQIKERLSGQRCKNFRLAFSRRELQVLSP